MGIFCLELIHLHLPSSNPRLPHSHLLLNHVSCSAFPLNLDKHLPVLDWSCIAQYHVSFLSGILSNSWQTPSFNEQPKTKVETIAPWFSWANHRRSHYSFELLDWDLLKQHLQILCYLHSYCIWSWLPVWRALSQGLIKFGPKICFDLFIFRFRWIVSPSHFCKSFSLCCHFLCQF